MSSTITPIYNSQADALLQAQIVAAGVPQNRPPAYAYGPGKVYHTDFSNAEYDAALFAITGFTRTTDGSIPALQLTATGTKGTIFTNDAALKNVDVRLKYRTVAGGGFGLQDIGANVYARRLGPNNYWRGARSNTVGNVNSQGHSLYAGADQPSAASTADADSSSTAVYRFLRMQVIEDMIFLKSWLEGAAEPVWHIAQRLRPPAGPAATTTADNVDVGAAGMDIIYNAGYLSELTVTELVRIDNNFLHNGDFGLTDTSNSVPAFWFPTVGGGLTVGNTVGVVSAADRLGVTRNILQLVRTATDTNSQFWSQNVYNPLLPGPNSFNTRKRPRPQSTFPPAVEVSVWTKGTGLAFTGGAGALGASIVTYYYDKDGGILNVGPPTNTYYTSLGPNASGLGTWDWTETRFRMPFLHWERCIFSHTDIGFHDGVTTGTLLISDPSFRPCA